MKKNDCKKRYVTPSEATLKLTKALEEYVRVLEEKRKEDAREFKASVHRLLQEEKNRKSPFNR